MAPSEKALKKLLLADAEGRDLTRLAEYEKVGGYESLKKAMKMEPQAVLDELLAADVRGRGGAGFPDGSQGELPAQAGPDDEADLPRRERRRVGARHLQGPRDPRPAPAHVHRGLRDRLARDRGEHGLHLHSRGVPRGVRDSARRARGGPQGGPRRSERPRLGLEPHGCRPPRGRCVHLRRGDRPSRVARGQARAAALEAALPGHLRRLRLADAHQQRRDARDRPEDPRARRGELREARCRELPRHASLLALRATWSTAATTRSSWARACAS